MTPGLSMLLLILGLVFFALVALLWVGTLWVQGYLYETVVAGPEMYWRAPAAGAALTLFLGLWCYLDYRAYDPQRPGLKYDSIFSVGLSEHKPPVEEFEAVRQNKRTPYKRFSVARAPGYEYRDAQNRPWTRSEAVIIKENDEEARFEADRDEKGNYRVESGSSLRYTDPKGRVMTEDAIGRLSVTHWGLFFANMVLNVLHLVLWFVCLWLLMRFQWSQALLLALGFWLMMTLFILPMLLERVQIAAQQKAAAAAATALWVPTPTGCNPWG